MESKITLVEGVRPTTRFLFNRNSALNANLLVDGIFRYTISTKDKDAMKTNIIDSITKRELVTIKKRIILSNKITFADRYGGKEQRLSDVLKETKLEDGFPVHMIQTDQGDFYWKVHPVYRLAFFSISDPIHPVAYRETVVDPIVTFALVINRGYENIADYIIATFLVLEQNLRMDEKESSIADGIICENRTLLGTYVNTGGRE